MNLISWLLIAILAVLFAGLVCLIFIVNLVSLIREDADRIRAGLRELRGNVEILVKGKREDHG